MKRLMNKMNITYYKDGRLKHDCELVIANEIAPLFLNTLEILFRMELLEGEIQKGAEETTVFFQSTKQKLKMFE